jgi:hypothetical protein
MGAAVAGSADLVQLAGPVVDELGVYQLELARRDGQMETRPICVNLDQQESDLKEATSDELDRALGDIPHVMLASSGDFLADEQTARSELWPTLLWILIVLLMCEQALAWWFGRRESAVIRDDRASAGWLRGWVVRRRARGLMPAGRGQLDVK